MDSQAELLTIAGAFGVTVRRVSRVGRDQLVFEGRPAKVRAMRRVLALSAPSAPAPSSAARESAR